jgi:hypothetical protein
MWGDAGKHSWGHALAEMNPFRWSNWAGPADTIQNLQQYNKRGDASRPVEMEFGPPPIQSRTFSNIAEAVEYLNSQPAPSTTEPSYTPSSMEPAYSHERPAKAAATTPYPEGVFTAVGAGNVQILDGELARGVQAEDILVDRKLPWVLQYAAAGFVILAIPLAFYRSRVAAQSPEPDEEAPLDPPSSNEE